MGSSVSRWVLGAGVVMWGVTGVGGEKIPSFSDWSGAGESIAALAEGYDQLRAGHGEAARVVFAEVVAEEGAPPHHRREAARRVEEMDRQGVTAAAGKSHSQPPRPGMTIHVAAEGSGDAGEAKGRWVSSPAEARDLIREIKAGDGLPEGGVEIRIHGGAYGVEETLVLDGRDSGTDSAPIVYRGDPENPPVFRGGVELRGFRPVQDKAVLERLPEEARGKVWHVGLGDYGVEALLPLRLGGFASGHGFRTFPAHELFVDGEAMRPARGPNDGYLHIEDVVVKDGTRGYDREGSKVGRFVYSGDRPARWVEEPDLLLYGYWFWGWADSYERVVSIDPARRVIEVASPYHKYGYSIGAPFYAVNALCELDAPGEWYLDRESATVYLFSTEDPASRTVEFSMFPGAMVELSDVSFVRFEGITWELGSGDAINIRGGEGCVIAGCTIRRFAGDAVSIRGGSDHSLLSSDLYTLGRGGVLLDGGDRKTLRPGGHLVENCGIRDLSRIDHTYTPGVIVRGVGNRVAHNDISEIASSGMRVGGNDHIIEYNEVHHVVLESDDQGGADMYGNPTYRGNIYRFNYWHDIGTPYGPLGEDSKLGQAGIRLDDAICGTLIYGNVFQRSSSGKRGFGGVQIHGGKDNIIDNNLFLDGRAVLTCTPWNEKRWTETAAGALTKGDVDGDLYRARYPALGTLDQARNRNALWRNISVRCRAMVEYDSGVVQDLENVDLGTSDRTLRDILARPPLPAFAPIPFDRIGLYEDAYRSLP